jgi:methylenetetrahydrofolate reductase (NADPH)
MHAFDTGLPIRGHCRPDPMGTILNTFRDAIRSKDFVVTAELPLPAGQSMADLQENLSVLQSVVDAVQVGCDEGTDAQIAELAAGRIAREAGVDAIVQLSSRDRNRIAMQNDILGATALGVTALVPRRGEKLDSTLRGRVKGVFDTKVVQLLTIARRIGENSRFVDGELLLGCLVTAFRPQENWDASRVTEKIDAGAGFLQTRPCADIGLIHDYVSRLVSQRLTHRAAVIVGLPLLLSEARARSIVDRHPGTIVPEALIATLAGASDPRREGIAALAGMLSELAATPGVSGVAIVDVNDVEAVAEAIRLSGVLDQAGSG